MSFVVYTVPFNGTVSSINAFFTRKYHFHETPYLDSVVKLGATADFNKLEEVYGPQQYFVG